MAYMTQLIQYLIWYACASAISTPGYWLHLHISLCMGEVHVVVIIPHCWLHVTSYVAAVLQVMQSYAVGLNVYKPSYTASLVMAYACHMLASALLNSHRSVSPRFDSQR